MRRCTRAGQHRSSPFSHLYSRSHVHFLCLLVHSLNSAISLRTSPSSFLYLATYSIHSSPCHRSSLIPSFSSSFAICLSPYAHPKFGAILRASLKSLIQLSENPSCRSMKLAYAYVTHASLGLFFSTVSKINRAPVMSPVNKGSSAPLSLLLRLHFLLLPNTRSRKSEKEIAR